MGIVIERVTGEAAKKIVEPKAPPGIYVPSHLYGTSISGVMYVAYVVKAVYELAHVSSAISHAYVLTPTGEFLHINDFVDMVCDKLSVPVEKASVPWFFSDTSFSRVCDYDMLARSIIAKLESNLTL